MKKVFAVLDKNKFKDFLNEGIYEACILLDKTEATSFMLRVKAGKYQMCRKNIVTGEEQVTYIEESEFNAIKTQDQEERNRTLEKYVHQINKSSILNDYLGNFNELTTLVVEDDVNLVDSNLIDITDMDIANENKLLNLDREEFKNEMFQIMFLKELEDNE